MSSDSYNATFVVKATPGKFVCWYFHPLPAPLLSFSTLSTCFLFLLLPAREKRHWWRCQQIHTRDRERGEREKQKIDRREEKIHPWSADRSRRVSASSPPGFAGRFCSCENTTKGGRERGRDGRLDFQVSFVFNRYLPGENGGRDGTTTTTAFSS